MKMSINHLRDVHKGEDVWVVASGPSAGFVAPEFLVNKVSIGVNWAFLRFPVDYVVLKDYHVIRKALEMGQTVVASLHSAGNVDGAENVAEQDFFCFGHKQNHLKVIDFELGEDELVVSYSTITSAMHLAAYMGAANVILIGHDCGLIDGQRNYEGYPECPIKLPGWSYEGFVSQIEPQSQQVRAWLEEKYGCRVYSLNPWLNVGLEGHRWRRV